MSLMTENALDALVKHSSPNSVSIWMPAHRAGAEIRQDPIRMKNLLTRAEEQMTAVGMRSAEARERLAEARTLTEDADFWRHQSAGLGVLAGGGPPEVIRLPVAAPELVVVSDGYHLRPLFATPRPDERFYLLVLGKQAVRLYRADRFDIEPMNLPDAPASFTEFIRFDDPERHLDFHTGTAGHQPAADRPAVFHGQGAGGDESWEKARQADFCRQVDAAVVKALYGEDAPLLLAGAEPLAGLYGDVSSCPQLDDRVVSMDPDQTKPKDLHRRAVDLLAEDFERPVRQAADRYRQARGSGMAVGDLAAVLRGASAKAIETLLVSAGPPRWGRFEDADGGVERHDEQEPGDEDLLNRAAVLAARGGARVYAVDPEKLPDESPVAATLRFPLNL